MRIALTGATGFIGRYVVERLLSDGHELVAWYRPSSNRIRIEHPKLAWVEGDLSRAETMKPLLEDCQALVHAGLWRPGQGFRGGEGDLIRFAETNVMGSLRLFETALAEQVERIIYVSTCAVHEEILDDRPLDESHPLWPYSHYGAHKAAVEKFVHSYGLGSGINICAIRPSGVYGIKDPIETSKYFGLVGRIARGELVKCSRGGKEVHAADVAQSIACLLDAGEDIVRGQAFNCCDRYISEYDVAHLARDLCGSAAEIEGEPKSPKHQIMTEKIEKLGVKWGGAEHLEMTVRSLLSAHGASV